jgi:hypothetical protein
MNPKIKELLILMEHGNKNEQEESTRCLGLLLEKNSGCPDNLSFYTNVLPPDILGVVITEIERHALFSEIASLAVRLAEDGKANPGIFWILGKGSSDLVIEALLMSLCSHQAKLDDTSMMQLLFSLGNFIGGCGGYSDNPNRVKLFHDYDLFDALKTAANIRPLNIAKLARDLSGQIGH